MMCTRTAALLLVPMLCAMASASPCCKTQATIEDLDRAMHGYLEVWNGNLSLVDSVFAPNLTLNADLFPRPTGQGTNAIGPLVTSSVTFGGWVQQARNSFESYAFTLNKFAASGNNAALRWTLNAVMPQNFTALPTNLEPGDPVTYNGTDFLTLNPCTGLIVEVAVAQDLLSFLNNLGNDVTFTPRATN